jgi:Ser/Thr protein kinase RdoA (MazF antagonist)
MRCLTSRNAHLADDGAVTLYDFDSGGPGWRAYDLATFLMEARKHPQADALWEAYLHGYTEQRSLGAREHEAIPLFLAARYYWSIGLTATIASEDIQAPLDDAYLDRMIAYLRQWEAERIAPQRRAEAPPTLYRGY